MHCFQSEMDHGLPHAGESSKQSVADHPPYRGSHGQPADDGGCVLFCSQPLSIAPASEPGQAT